MTVYDVAVLADSPLVYWKLDETAGTNADDSTANNRDGTYTNGPTLNQQGPAPNIPKSVDFDGTNDYVQGPAASNVFAPTNLSVEFWVYFDDVTTVQEVVCYDNDAAPNWAVYMGVAAGTIRFRRWTTTDAQNVDIAGFVAGTWYHVIFTSTGAAQLGYVNKVLTTGTPVVGTLRTTSTRLDLAALAGASATNGKLAAFAVYDSILSATRVAAHYDAAFAAGNQLVNAG